MLELNEQRIEGLEKGFGLLQHDKDIDKQPRKG